MKEENIDLWSKHREGKWVAVTTNGSFKRTGENVMGTGCARECAELFPEFPMEVGATLKRLGNNLLGWADYEIVTFPVKYHWSDMASITLISRSCMQLKEFLDENPAITEIYVPRPGCGAGRLNWERDVKPIMLKFFDSDDRVIIVHKEETE